MGGQKKKGLKQRDANLFKPRAGITKVRKVRRFNNSDREEWVEMSLIPYSDMWNSEVEKLQRKFQVPDIDPE